MYNSTIVKKRIVIIGAGVVGSAIAYTLSRNKNFEITVLEKNKTIPGLNQSSRNAGVTHAGIYYSNKNEPLKSQMCVEGNELLLEFCKKEGIPHKQTGKLIVATNELEKEYLDYFYKSAVANKVPGIKKLTEKEAKEFEPNITAKYALYLPTSGIVDVDKLILRFKKISEERGTKFVTSAKVIDIKSDNNGSGFVIKATVNKKLQRYEADMVINSAGLYSDDIARMIDKDSPYEILPSRGEFAQFKNNSNLKISMNIYPSPHGFYTATGEKALVGVEEFLKLHKEGVVTRTVGVHITPTLTASSSLGDISIIGPAKTVNVSKKDYTKKVKPMGHFFKKVTGFHPSLKKKDLSLFYTGIMASEKTHKDFIIQRDKKFKSFINLIGIDSPGMTASLAIARYVEKIVNETN